MPLAEGGGGGSAAAGASAASPFQCCRCWCRCCHKRERRWVCPCVFHDGFMQQNFTTLTVAGCLKVLIPLPACRRAHLPSPPLLAPPCPALPCMQMLPSCVAYGWRCLRMSDLGSATVQAGILRTWQTPATAGLAWTAMLMGTSHRCEWGSADALPDALAWHP